MIFLLLTLKAVDIIMYAKDLVDQQNITDDQVRSAVTQAADHFGVSLSDSEVDSLVSVVRKGSGCKN